MKTIFRTAAVVGVVLSLFIFISGVSAQDDEFIEIGAVEENTESDVLGTDAVEKHDVSKPTPVSTKKPQVKKQEPAPSLAKVTKIMAVELSGSVEVRIMTTQKVKYKATDLNPPPNYRILVQLMKTGIETETIKAGKGSVRRIRSAPHNSTAWVVIDLTGESKWKIRQDGNTIIVDIPKKSSRAAVSERKEQERKIPSHKPGAMIYRIIDVSGKSRDNKTRIIITADGPVKYRIKKDSEKKLLYLNIIDAVSIWKDSSFKINRGSVERVSLFESAKSKTVDIKIELRENSPYTVVRDQNQILIEVDDLPSSAAKYKKRLNLKEKISINVQGAELPGVLRLLSAQTGFEFSTGPSVAGAAQVTIREDDQTLEKVLKDILMPRNLYFEVREGMIHVGAVEELKAARKLRPQITKFYSPRVMKPENLRDMLNVQLQKEPLMDVLLQVDETAGSNRIMMVGTSEDVDRVMDMIALVDASGSGDSADYEGGLKTRVFKLQYVNPGDIESMMKELMSEDGKVQVDSRTGSIVVTDSMRYLKKMEQVIKRLDVRIPQVMIEAKLYEININAAKNIGVDWSAVSQSDEPFIQGDVSIIPGAGAGELMVGLIQNGFRIDAYLNALETKNEASLLSSPKVTVETNKLATMYTTRTTYYETTNITQGDSGPPVVTTTYESINLPIELKVTPKITDDNKIGMNVGVIVTKILGQATSGGPPDTSSQQAQTYVTASNNETVVIGGMISERISYSENKVPLLGDLPLIGGLFQGTSQSKDRVELVVFLTPSIVQE